MIYRITYEDGHGPSSWNCTEAHVEAKSLADAVEYIRKRFPRAMINSAAPLDIQEERPYNTYIA